MELLPQRILVTVPANQAARGGIHAVTKPHGVVTSFRCTNDDMRKIDEALNLVDPNMSRGLFMRQAAVFMAEAISQHVTRIREMSAPTGEA